MKGEQHITSFYVEALLLIAAFIGILLALTRVFGLSRNESLRAKLLTNAVTLAENAADAFMAEETEPRGAREDRFTADMAPDPAGVLAVRVAWQREEGLLRGTVTVQRGAETLYTLPLCKYVGEVSP